jgi:CRP-like cAMP-binding protein
MGKMTPDTIPKIELFKGLTRDELGIIAAHYKRVHFTKDHVFIQEGEQVSALFIVLKGELRVFLPKRAEGIGTLRSTDVDLNILSEGDCFGEYSLIDREPASASVVAMDHGQILEISHDVLERILISHDRMAKIIYYNMLRMLIRRLKEKDTEIDLLLIGR